MMLGSEALAGHDHGAADREHVVGRPRVASLLRVQEVREAAGRVVAHEDLRLDAERLERAGLVVRVLLHAAPEGPRVGDDDAYLHLQDPTREEGLLRPQIRGSD